MEDSGEIENQRATDQHFTRAYCRLAAAVLRHAIKDAKAGHGDASMWLRKEGPNGGAEWWEMLGLDPSLLLRFLDCTYALAKKRGTAKPSKETGDGFLALEEMLDNGEKRI